MSTENKVMAEVLMTNEEIKGASDVSIAEDNLGLDTYVTGLANYIRDCTTPMTISIQGDWGAGKTTLFKLVEKELNGEDNQNLNYPVIEVNTWQFAVAGYEDNMVYVLIQLICKKLKELLDKIPVQEESKKQRLKKGEKKKSLSDIVAAGKTLINNIEKNSLFLQPLANIPLAALLEKALGSIATEKIYEMLEKDGITLKNENLYIEEIENLKEQMKLAIEKVCTAYDEVYGKQDEKKTRLIIFIDDLDRLEPESAVELLEGLKNFLDCDNCVFILALDQNVVFRGIEEKYGKEDGKKLGTKFFDKIIQMPFTLPVASYDASGYIEKLRPNDTWKTQARFLEVIEHLTDKNPRTVKRLFNMLLLHEKIENISSDEDDKKVLLLAILAFSLKEANAYKTLIKTANENSEKELRTLIEKPKSKYSSLRIIMDSVSEFMKEKDAYLLLKNLLKGSVSASVATMGEELIVSGEIAPLFNRITRLISRNTNFSIDDEKTEYRNRVTRMFKAEDGAYVRLIPEKDSPCFKIILSDSKGKYKFFERIKEDTEVFENHTDNDLLKCIDKLAYKGSKEIITIGYIYEDVNFDLLGYLYDNYISEIGNNE